MERTSDPLSLELGIHGIYIRSGSARAVFLPQVPVEQGWQKEEYLSRCCQAKGGMSADAWRRPDTEVYLFTAEVFGDLSMESGEAADNPAHPAG
jgi:AMMECR1 domain-containing protein